MSLKNDTEHGIRRCASKRVYASWEEAEDAALLLQEDIRDGRLPDLTKKGALLAYRCAYCTNWHVAHVSSHKVRSSWTQRGGHSVPAGLHYWRALTAKWAR